MIKIDLITGFLGAGKTTFLKKYAKYLLDQGLSIGILENDFGVINVDMMLLNELRGENCELEMVTACCGNDPEAHRRRFKTKLISMGMSGYDRVLVEPSGIFDVDEFFDILYDEPLNRWYEAGNVIAIADAGLEENLSVQADYILASELAGAGKILLSRVQEATEKEIAGTVAHLNRALAQVKCTRRLIPGEDVLAKNWDSLTAEDFEALLHCGYRSEAYVKEHYEEDGDFDSVFFLNVQMTKEELLAAVRQMLADASCGEILRVKGFLHLPDDSWLELNATRRGIRVSPIDQGQEVLIVIGERLDKERLAGYIKTKEDCFGETGVL